MRKRDHCRFACQASSDVLSNTAGSKLKPAVLAWASPPAWATSRQSWLEHHCQLEPQPGIIALSITVGSSHKLTVLAWASLSARATSRQCLLEHHCRLEPQAGSVGSTDTSGWCQEPTVLSAHHWRFWELTVMWTPHHYRYATASLKSGSEGGFWTESDILIWVVAIKAFQ